MASKQQRVEDEEGKRKKNEEEEEEEEEEEGDDGEEGPELPESVHALLEAMSEPLEGLVNASSEADASPLQLTAFSVADEMQELNHDLEAVMRLKFFQNEE